MSDLDQQLRTWRQHLHQHPETGFDEHATGDYIATQLAALRIPVARGFGGTGLVGSIRRGQTSGPQARAIGLRADMDALALMEHSDMPYRSVNAGTMHACGHDGHMAMVLGAAAVLSQDDSWEGTVHLVFQPAEEHGQGARAMIADGLFDAFRMDAIYGLHNLPGLPAGQVHNRVGPIMATEDNFEITITGRGGHAARPHMVIDPLVVAAEIILALQSIVARNVEPGAGAVVSCTEIHSDGVRNAIPTQVVIRGDTRSFDPAVQALLERRIRELADGIAAAHGASAHTTYTHEFGLTVNHPDASAALTAAARGALGEEAVVDDCPPVMASEDFGEYGYHIPACFAFLGNGTEPGAGGTPLHSREYDFNDDILRAGVEVYVHLVRAQLPRGRVS